MNTDTLAIVSLTSYSNGVELQLHTKNDKHIATPLKNNASLKEVHHQLLMTVKAFETLIRSEDDLNEFHERVG